MRTGRPLKRIDKKKFEALLATHNSLAQTARALRCSSATIERHCARRYKLGFKALRKKLRIQFLNRVFSVEPIVRQPSPDDVLGALRTPMDRHVRFEAMTQEECIELMWQMQMGLVGRRRASVKGS